MTGLVQTADDFVAQLNERGLPSRHYTVPQFTGYNAVTQSPVDVLCIESLLGPSPWRAGYSTYALAQTFLTDYPSLSLSLIVELADADRSLCQEPARFSYDVDKQFSTIFLPTLFTAFNPLDRVGKNKSLVVQSYNSAMTLQDFLQASLLSARIMTSFKAMGQLALVAVDYYDPITIVISRVMQAVNRVLKQPIHLVIKTNQPSSLQIPVQSMGNQYNLLRTHSTALEAGIAIAKDYFDRHYRA